MGVRSRLCRARRGCAGQIGGVARRGSGQAGRIKERVREGLGVRKGHGTGNRPGKRWNGYQRINMSESNDQDGGKGRLSLRPAGRLELGRTVPSGSVRQSFSHGRSKVVQGEVRKKRAPLPTTPSAAAGAPAPTPAGGTPAPRAQVPGTRPAPGAG